MPFVSMCFHNELIENTPRLLPLDIHRLLGGFEFLNAFFDRLPINPTWITHEYTVQISMRLGRFIFSSSSDWTRTSDLAVNSRSLYQLSYGGSGEKS